MQRDFAKALRDPNKLPPAAVVDPRQVLSRSQADNDIVNRFNVYRNNVIYSLSQALCDGFPTLEKLVGKEYMLALMREFINEHPPKSPVLTYYGAQLSDFIATFSPLEHLPYLPDMARLDYLRTCSYNGADFVVDYSPPPADITQATPLINPTINILCSSYPVLDIYRHSHSIGEQITSAGQNLMIIRKENTVQMHILPIGGEIFLQAMRRPDAGCNNMHQVVVATLAANPDADIAECMSLALQSGAIIGFKVTI